MYKRVHSCRLHRCCKIVLTNRPIKIKAPLENMAANCQYAKCELNYIRTVINLYENRLLLTPNNSLDFPRWL